MPDAPVSSASNPLVKRLRALKRRGDDASCLLEGPKLVGEALSAGIVLEAVVASPRFLAAPAGRALVAACAAAGLEVRRIEDRLLDALSEAEASQGVLALARRPRFSEDALFAGVPLVLVAVGVQNPGNVGALLRSTEAAGGTGAYLADGCADPFSWKALRGSMGSAFRLPHFRAASREALGRLRSRGVRVVAADAGAGTSYDGLDWKRPTAVLVGNEGAGLPESIAADERVRIPMAGGAESLNVAVAAAILLFEAARQRRSMR
ncbi:MAG TPA: RNA methyltransferase [Vicinamibacteria bacterium]